MAVYRHRPQTIAALEKMVDAYAEERSSEIGEVGSDCRIVGARFIREVRIGNDVEIDGASILENATLCDGARVGVDVKAYDCKRISRNSYMKVWNVGKFYYIWVTRKFPRMKKVQKRLQELTAMICFTSHFCHSIAVDKEFIC